MMDDFDDFLNERLESDEEREDDEQEEELVKPFTVPPPTTTTTTTLPPSSSSVAEKTLDNVSIVVNGHIEKNEKKDTATPTPIKTTESSISTCVAEKNNQPLVVPDQSTIQKQQQQSDQTNNKTTKEAINTEIKNEKQVETTKKESQHHPSSIKSEDEVDLDTLLNEAEREDINFSKQQNQEVILQFWSHTIVQSDAPDADSNSDSVEKREESELNEKINKFLVPNVSSTKPPKKSSPTERSKPLINASPTLSDSNVSEQSEDTASTTTTTPSEPAVLDAKQQRVLERQKQRQRLKQYLTQLESSNASLTKKLHVRDERLNLAKQRWTQERTILLDMLKEKGVEVDVTILQNFYNINELDQINDDDDNANESLFSSMPASLVTASEMLSSLIASFSEPVQQTKATAQPAAVPTKPQQPTQAQAAPESVLDSFKGWIWGSPASTSTQSETSPRRKQAEIDAARRKREQATRKKQTVQQANNTH